MAIHNDIMIWNPQFPSQMANNVGLYGFFIFHLNKLLNKDTFCHILVPDPLKGVWGRCINKLSGSG